MNNVYKGKAKYISASIVMALVIVVTIASTDKLHESDQFYKTLTADTIPGAEKNEQVAVPVKIAAGTDSAKRDTLPITQNNDSSVSTIQKTDTLHFKVSKDSLD